MSPVTTPSSIIFGCVTDQQDRKFLDQAVRLVASLRWFGGVLSHSPFVVCAVDGLPPAHAECLSQLGATIHPVERFDTRHGPSNKLRFLEYPDLASYDVVALLDCDTLIVQDPSVHLKPSGFAAKAADLPTVTAEQFQRLFAYFGIPMPPLDRTADITGTPMPPYFNAGVCVFSRETLPVLTESWIRWDRRLLDKAHELAYPFFHTDQASLTLALTETATPITVLPSEMNLPVHLLEHRYPPRFHVIDPIIIHYHQMAQPGGGITKLPLAGAWKRAQMFNARLEKEGLMGQLAA